MRGSLLEELHATWTIQPCARIELLCPPWPIAEKDFSR